MNPTANVYLLDSSIHGNFKYWKAAFLYMLMQKADDELVEPAEVTEHTKLLIDRDNIIKLYVEERIKESTSDSILTSKMVCSDYLDYWKENNITDIVKRDVLETDISVLFRSLITLTSKTHRGFWKGFDFNDLIDSDTFDDSH